MQSASEVNKLGEVGQVSVEGWAMEAEQQIADAEEKKSQEEEEVE